MQLTETHCRNSAPDLPVVIGGRRFPLQSQDDTDNVPSPDHERTRVMEQLRQLVKQQLPWFCDSLPSTTTELTQVYTESLQRIIACVEEAEALVPLLCKANFEFRHENGHLSTSARSELTSAKLNEMAQKAELKIRHPVNVINARLLALSHTEVSEQYRQSLESNVDRLVSDFFIALDRLVDQQVAGVVEWTSKSTCCYHFFREVVIREQTDTYVDVNVRGRRQSEESHTGWMGSQDVTHSGTHTHRIARHEHHTIDAFHTSIDNSTVVMPQSVAALCSGIPKWLEPVVRVIDGKLVRELIIERDQKTEKWEQHETRDVPVFDCEPAVVIDRVVLTGWGPTEINRELARRSSIERQERVSHNRSQAQFLAPASFCLAICLSAFSLWLFATTSNLLTSFLPLAFAIPCWSLGFSMRATAIRIRQSYQQPIIASLGLTAVLTAVGLVAAFRLRSLEAYLAAIALCGVGIFTMAIARWLTLADQAKEPVDEQ